MKTRSAVRGFSLVEMLIVLAIIGIMASIVITQMANAAVDSRRAVSRQQQVVLQEAVNNWLSQYCASSSTMSISAARTAYNAKTTAADRLSLVGPYLDPSTVSQFTAMSGDTAKLQTDAMRRIGKWIEMPTWDAASYPQVNLFPVD